jgi:putative transcriptional regulator
MSKQYRSDAMASIHETMEALHKVGAIDKQTMRRFDDACLNPRGAADAAPHQQVGVGEKKPSGPALKLLSLVEKHGITAVA